MFLSKLTLLALVAPGPLLIACSCIVPRPVCNSYWSTKAVFLGQVISIRDEPQQAPSAWQRVAVDFQVREAFRGVTEERITIRTGRGGGDCGYGFEVGGTYLVFADGTPLTTGICSGTAPLEKAQAALDYIHGIAGSPAGGSLYGQVLSGNDLGQPVSGIRVTATGQKVLTAMTDGVGNYRLSQLPAGDYTVTFDLPANLSNRALKVSVPDRGCAQADMFTRVDGHIRGRVTDSGGNGVADLDVQAIPWASRKLLQGALNGTNHLAHTGPDGNYDLGLLPSGDYMLVAGQFPTIDIRQPVYAAEYYPHAGSRDGAAPIHIGDGQHVDDINFTVAGPLEWKNAVVRTLLPDGTPVQGAQLRFAPLEMGFLFVGTPASDREGNIPLRMADHTSYLICASGKGLLSSTVVVDSTAVQNAIPIVLNTPGTGECPEYRKLAQADRQ